MKRIIVFAIALLAATQLFALSDSENSTLHNLLIKFYGYQRAGLKTGSCNNLNSGFTNASHNGDNLSGSPLDGGWYDAGDYIKFGMNLSYSVYCLLKGYDVFPSGYSDNYSWDYKGADGVPDILNEVKFATDYIIKAVISDSKVVLDVGNANSEHGSTSVANNPGGRSGNDIYLCSGADIPATYAACLGLMSTLYRKYDAAYADKCLLKAKEAFIFAKNKYASNALYCNTQGTFYTYPTVNNSTTRPINDRKVAAGVELYRAVEAAKQTQDPLYKAWAKLTITGLADCMGYAYIGPLASFEAWRQGFVAGPTDLLLNVGFIGSRIKDSGKFNKVYQNGGWGTARDAGTAAFEMALSYVFNSDKPARTAALERINNHINWVVGKGANNTQSFVCGFNNGPKNAHYRSNGFKAVPGGVVAGPDPSGNWQDNGGLYQFTEVAIDYNAGIIGAVAFLRALTNPGSGVKISEPFAANPRTNLDFTKSSTSFSAKFSTSVKWAIKISGASGSKTFTGSGTSISQAWDGSADQGAILGGESVAAVLSLDGAEIVSYDLAYASPINMSVLKNKKITPKSNDILIDDFEDGTMPNKINGTWSAFGTGTGFSISTATIATDSGSKALVLGGAVRTNDNKNWAGLKTTLGSSAVTNVGQIKSVLFDLRTNKNANVSVELEQSDISDNAYYSAVVPAFVTSNRYRVSISDFTQPEWKTSAKTLDLSKISSLRFTIYDSTGLVKLYLDNVYIEDFAATSVRDQTNNAHPVSFNQLFTNGTLQYTIPYSCVGAFNIGIYNVAGKNVLRHSFGNSAGKDIAFSLSALPSGIYTVVNSLNGEPMEKSMKLVHTR